MKVTVMKCILDRDFVGESDSDEDDSDDYSSDIFLIIPFINVFMVMLMIVELVKCFNKHDLE